MTCRLKSRLTWSSHSYCTYRQYGHQELASSYFLCGLEGRELFTYWAFSTTQLSTQLSKGAPSRINSVLSGTENTYGEITPIHS